MPSKVPKSRAKGNCPRREPAGFAMPFRNHPTPKILRRSLPLVGHFLIARLYTLIECAEPSFFGRGDVHEHVLAAVIGLNESIALCRVEPLHRSGCHLGRLP